MRFAVALALIAGIAAAQSPLGSQRDSAQLSGVVLEADHEASGEFSIRTPLFEVVRYRYDAATSVTREEHSVAVPALAAGDRVEIESAPLPDSPLRLARTVRVIEAAETVHVPHLRPAPLRMDEERQLLARGSMTFSGVVSRVGGGELVLRTREAGEQILRLRTDARFLEAGARVQPADLKPDTHVFIRAGRDLWGTTEVYEVAWGSILQPR